MTRNSITRLATASVVTGIATVAFAAPASAMVTPDPIGSGEANQQSAGTTGTDDGTPWAEMGLGALAGLGLAGVGVAAAAGLRHRQHETSPA